MKKFSLLIPFLTALIFCGYQSLCEAAEAKDSYKVLLLGDLHYDGMQYHTSPAATPNRAKERKRNCDMWEKATPELLTLAAKHADKDVPFVAQVGDFTQGDCETVDLQIKMLSDGFDKVKSYFPNHKLLPVRGNHDVRMYKGNNGAPTIKAFFPRIAKELGVKEITGSYSVRQGKDLYIFFDSFVRKGVSLKALEKILAENTDVRYTFFISHLPVLNCCTGNPAWLVSNFKAVRNLLLKRNAIIIAAHTHVPSLLQAERDGGKLTQVIVSTVGKSWRPEEKMNVHISGYDKYLARFDAKKLNTKKYKPSFDDMKTFKVTEFESYQYGTGFAVLKVCDDGVVIEFHTNASGKPSMVKKLR
jgi:hypothetical protein